MYQKCVKKPRLLFLTIITQKSNKIWQDVDAANFPSCEGLCDVHVPLLPSAMFFKAHALSYSSTIDTTLAPTFRVGCIVLGDKSGLDGFYRIGTVFKISMTAMILTGCMITWEITTTTSVASASTTWTQTSLVSGGATWRATTELKQNADMVIKSGSPLTSKWTVTLSNIEKKTKEQSQQMIDQRGQYSLNFTIYL